MHITTLEQQLNKQFPERHKAIRAIMLGVLTSQHVYLHGEPGTAKSLLARTALSALEGGLFTATLSTNRPPEAILGPYDVPALQKSQFLRHDEGYLTTATWAILDEIGKVGPALGHDLLAVLNERVKHEVSQGRSQHEIPLQSAVCTSNEEMSTQDSRALWDRLLIRTEVKPLTSLVAMTGAQPAELTTLTAAQIQADREQVVNVGFDATQTYQTLDTITKEARKTGLRISDRRALASIPVMQANAALEGRDKLTADDLLALEYTYWEPSKPNVLLTILAAHVTEPPVKPSGDFKTQLAQAKQEAKRSAARKKANADMPLIGVE